MSNVLTPGVVYFDSTGMPICARCAGYTARTTGRDLSGQPVLAATEADIEAFAAAGLGVPACECGTSAVRPLLEVLSEHVAAMTARRALGARCGEHPAYEADYCPVCGTARVIGGRA